MHSRTILLAALTACAVASNNLSSSDGKAVPTLSVANPAQQMLKPGVAIPSGVFAVPYIDDDVEPSDHAKPTVTVTISIPANSRWMTIIPTASPAVLRKYPTTWPEGSGSTSMPGRAERVQYMTTSPKDAPNHTSSSKTLSNDTITPSLTNKDARTSLSKQLTEASSKLQAEASKLGKIANQLGTGCVQARPAMGLTYLAAGLGVMSMAMWY